MLQDIIFEKFEIMLCLKADVRHERSGKNMEILDIVSEFYLFDLIDVSLMYMILYDKINCIYFDFHIELIMKLIILLSSITNFIIDNILLSYFIHKFSSRVVSFLCLLS